MSRVARLGMFVLLSLVILSAGVFVIGSKQYLFGSTFMLRAQFANVAGLSAGADVQVGGVHSGTVQSIELPHSPGGMVTVLMNLDRATHEIVKRDSVATIETEGVLGNQFVALSFGAAGQPDVKDGELIKSLPPLQVSDLLVKTSAILDSSQAAITNATMATAHLNSVSAKIDAGQGSIGALVNDRSLYNNLEQTTATLHDTMLEAQVGVTDFQENMEAMKHSFFLSGYFKKRGYEDASSLAANSIEALPSSSPSKEFSFSVKQLFDGRDSAKLKNQKTLKDAGEFLAGNPFAFAVVVVSSGTEGDAKNQLVLSQARAMVLREYLVENFGFDDVLLKTLGMGKQTGSGTDANWGGIRILIFPQGTSMPAAKPAAAGSSSITGSNKNSQSKVPPALD